MGLVHSGLQNLVNLLLYCIIHFIVVLWRDSCSFFSLNSLSHSNLEFLFSESVIHHRLWIVDMAVYLLCKAFEERFTSDFTI